MAGATEGGAETFFGRLAIGLQNAGIDQHVVLRPSVEREAMLQGAGVAVSTVPFGGLLDFSTRRAIRKRIADSAPDIVLSWMNRATSFCPARWAGQTFIHVGSPRGYYAPKYYRACDHLVVTTDDLARFYLDSGWPADRVDAIPNFVPDRRADPVARDRYDTPEDAPLLLALGRLHENKAFDIAIEALSRLPDCYLWLGGAGPLESDLKAQAEATGVADRVRFLGWVQDTAPLFAAADIFVCSSRHEPFGNIVIEAWLSGTPMVAADSEGPGSLIADEEDGLLVPVDDPAALASAIRALVEDKDMSVRLAAAGRQRYEEGFTEEKIVPRYVELFERLSS